MVTGTHLLERLTASDLFLLLLWDDYGWSSDIGGLAICDGTSLGVGPQLGHGLLEVLPSVPPPGQPAVSGSNIRVGTGSIDVTAAHGGNTWTTTVKSALACSLHIGATLPAGSTIQTVTLNGVPAAHQVRDTNAGRQVFVSTSCGSTAQVRVVAG